MPVTTQRSWWSRAWHNIVNGVTGGGITPPTQHNGVIRPHSPAAHVEGAITSLDGLITDLTDPTKLKHAAVRGGEVLVGVILLAVGVDHIFNVNATGKLAKVAPYMVS